MPDKIIAYTDGGSRGNPGPAAAGFILMDEHGNRLVAKGLFLGKNTNNVAEYRGLIADNSKSIPRVPTVALTHPIGQIGLKT